MIAQKHYKNANYNISKATLMDKRRYKKLKKEQNCESKLTILGCCCTGLSFAPIGGPLDCPMPTFLQI